MTENAVAAAERSEEQRIVALMVDYAENSEVRVVENAVDLTTSGYQQHLKIDPDLDQMNPGCPYSIAKYCQN